MNIGESIQDFIESTKRILTVSKKPTATEYNEMAKVTGVGIVLIGVIGFIVLMVFALLKIGA
ncbi:MAG: protein translocase SEC61 complex subunit gamma [Candidatus Diapherotrites archaeon]|uniref:Protein translocase subunit SecE n=1 Tax=Candidatus Iainarchaeum sp. TaxID=3101447 RepID=A0A8T4L715_9ARCH|nr:protein translocase SEC61 complex subunit gamma [Candidatus Diapherotrites archaeon]